MKEYQLEYLLAIVEMNTFTAASKHLNITQPTLSKAISVLEEEIGFRLFERNRNGIILTDEGIKFVAQAKNVVREMNELENCISRIKMISSEVTVGINPLDGCILIPAIEKIIAETNSDISIHWIEDGTYGLEEKLQNGSIDIAIMPSELANTDKFCSSELGKIENVICVSKRHKLAEKITVTPNELCEEKFVVFQDKISQGVAFRMLGITPVIDSYTSQIQTAVSLVESGKGILVLPRAIFEMYKRDYMITELEIEPSLELNMMALYKDGVGTRYCVVQNVVNIIKTALKNN